MLVFAQVSSMKTRRAGSILSWCRFHQARRRAMLGRSCSVANTVFFEADALALEEPPERVAGHHEAALEKFGGDVLSRFMAGQFSRKAFTSSVESHLHVCNRSFVEGI